MVDSARGSLAKYANTELWEKEGTAWEEQMGEKNMVMLDANVILRYLLNDNEKMALEAEKAIKTQTALVTIEVIAEVVYVLKRVYSIDTVGY